MKPSSRSIVRFFTNKYVIATLVFLVIILFIDENNYIVSHRLRQEVKVLGDRREELRADMVRDSIEASQLKYNREVMERYGRENYYMKRSGEDIYVIHKSTRSEQREKHKLLKRQDADTSAEKSSR